jgi:hypothetical protein
MYICVYVCICVCGCVCMSYNSIHTKKKSPILSNNTKIFINLTTSSRTPAPHDTIPYSNLDDSDQTTSQLSEY